MGDMLGINQQRGSACVSLSMQEKNPENVPNAAESSNDNEESKNGGGKKSLGKNILWSFIP